MNLIYTSVRSIPTFYKAKNKVKITFLSILTILKKSGSLLFNGMTYLVIRPSTCKLDFLKIMCKMEKKFLNERKTFRSPRRIRRERIKVKL